MFVYLAKNPALSKMEILILSKSTISLTQLLLSGHCFIQHSPPMFEGHGEKVKFRPAVKLSLLLLKVLVANCFPVLLLFEFYSSRSVLFYASCLFAGRLPVSPCLQTVVSQQHWWKLPPSYVCLVGGRGRVQTAAEARNSTWRRVHSHFSTDDAG